jgi:hypothetical protein
VRPCVRVRLCVMSTLSLIPSPFHSLSLFRLSPPLNVSLSPPLLSVSLSPPGQWERGLDAHNLHEADRILKESEPKMRAARMAYKVPPPCVPCSPLQ